MAVKHGMSGRLRYKQVKNYLTASLRKDNTQKGKKDYLRKAHITAIASES